VSFSNVPAVRVLVPEIDFFYWPSISGEKYAPTLTSAAYASTSAGPAVQPNGGAGSTVQYPLVPGKTLRSGTYGKMVISFHSCLTPVGFTSASTLVYQLSILGSLVPTPQLNIVSTDGINVAINYSNAFTRSWSSLAFNTNATVLDTGAVITVNADGTYSCVYTHTLNGVASGTDTVTGTLTRSATAAKSPLTLSWVSGPAAPGPGISSLQVTYS